MNKERINREKGICQKKGNISGKERKKWEDVI